MYGNVFYSGGSVPDMDEDFCKAVIKLSDNFSEQEATVIDGRTDTNIRSNSLYAIDDEKFKAIVFDWVQTANLEMGWLFDLTGVENLQLSKYTEQERYGWHYDIQPGNKCRKLTFNVVLNDDYEGGDFQFSWGSPSAPYRKRVIAEPALERAGKIVVFPSYYYHRVTPVTKGVRYSLTGWAWGPPFK